MRPCDWWTFCGEFNWVGSDEFDGCVAYKHGFSGGNSHCINVIAENTTPTGWLQSPYCDVITSGLGLFSDANAIGIGDFGGGGSGVQ